MELKRKRIAILVGVAVFAGLAMRFCSAEQENGEPDGRTANFSWGDDTNSLSKTRNDLDTGELFAKMIGAVAVVVALGIAMVYVSRKYLPKIGAATGKKIRVTETVALGPRKTLHLVQVGGRTLLIGGSAENISMLADLTDADTGADTRGEI